MSLWVKCDHCGGYINAGDFVACGNCVNLKDKVIKELGKGIGK